MKQLSSFSLKNFLPKSLLGRSLIILVTPLIIVQVILGYIFFDRHTEAILNLLSDSIAGQMEMVSQLIEKQQDTNFVIKLAEKNLELKVKLHPNQTIDKTGAYRERWLYQFMTDALDQHLKYPYYLKIEDNKIQVSLAHPRGLLKFETPRKRLYSRTTPLVIIWTTVSAVLLLIISSVFMRNQIQPIRRLADAAEKFGKGLAIDDFRPSGATEVRKAGQAFNIMRERLHRYIQERTDMLAGVSHDLRTPLARMKLQLAMMKQTAEVNHLQEDVKQMQSMIEGFLNFARGIQSESVQEVDLTHLLTEVIHDFRHSNLTFHLDSQAPLKGRLKINLFKRCLTNLVLNSERYGKNVWFSAKVIGKFIWITIEDDGPGIPEEERENVFRPFYRLDQSRNLDTGGVGLGLSIARDVVRSHGGMMTLEHSAQGGLRVVIKIPC
jgi:two-component system, OmpR family, osmolarity sensor histidine kinase EnvZ